LARLQLGASDVAVVLDTEDEYTQISEMTAGQQMLAALTQRRQSPKGITQPLPLSGARNDRFGLQG
jgi:hypothetical protein